MSRSAKGSIDAPGRNVKAKSGLNRSLSDSGMHQFATMLSYKADWYGRELHRVDPRYTSQQCSVCGHVEKENRHKIKFQCKSCDHQDHADVNAAKNILARALASVPQRKAVA